MWNASDIDAAIRRPAHSFSLANGLEHEYDRRQERTARRQICLALAGVLFLTTIGLLSDAEAGILRPALTIKVLIHLPVILAGLAAALWLPLPPRFLWLTAGIPFAVTVAVVAVIGLETQPPITDRYMTIAGLTAFGANVAIPFKFRDSLGLTLVNTALLVGIPLSTAPYGEVAPYVDILLFMSVVAFATTVLVYNRERSQKQAFLLTLANERQTIEYQALVDELTQLAHHDPLTGAGNRRNFDIRYQATWRTAVLRREQLALILIDIDHFKLLNDAAGHLEGDACLKSVASAIARGAQCPLDAVARFGGEEFALVLQSTHGRTAEAIRQSVEALAIPHPGLAPGSVVTVSIGKAYARPGTGNLSPEALLNSADEALYEAKKTGRNRVVVRGHVESVAA